MSTTLIIFTGILYLYISLEQAFRYKNYGMGICYFGNAFANIGIYMLMGGSVSLG